MVSPEEQNAAPPSVEMGEDAVEPERFCAGCRTRAPREALLRFAIRAEEPRLVADITKRLPGRGVSVHPTRACVEMAVKRGGFARALKSPVTQTAAELADMAAAQYARRVEGLLLAAARTRAVAAGTDVVRTALNSGSLEALVVATDAAGRREELVERAEALGRRAVLFGKKTDLGRLFRRAEVGVLGILDEGIAREVVDAATHATDLSEARTE